MSEQQQAEQGLGFRVERRPRGLAGDSRPWVVQDSGRMRLASAEETALWDALAAAQARVAEMEAQADAAAAEQEEGQGGKGKKKR